MEKIEVEQSVLDAYEERISSLKDEVKTLTEKQKGMVEMSLQYQGYIDNPPRSKEQLYSQACANDGTTINSWQKIWLDQIASNVNNYPIEDDTVMKLHGMYHGKPGICAGSGPSLKRNAKHLANVPDYMALTSCLHNYAYFVDEGIDADFYVNLDAGPITIAEVAQGGKKSEQYYWDSTQDKVLIAALVSHPDLIKKWKGKIYWYNTLGPTKEFIDALREITKYNVVYNVGGNTLGAVMYHTRAIIGCMPVAFVGADFAFDYTKKFHPFDSPYDNQYAGLIPATDVFGNRVYTWQSYYNFKAWFDFQACGGNGNNPCMFYNCTEGGILGAYAEGNIRQINQVPLADFIHMYRHHEVLSSLLTDESHPYAFAF